MGAGPRTNLYSIGCDPLTQLTILNSIFLIFFSSSSKETLTVRKWTENILLVTHWPTYATNRTFQPKHSTSIYDSEQSQSRIKIFNYGSEQSQIDFGAYGDVGVAKKRYI